MNRGRIHVNFSYYFPYRPTCTSQSFHHAPHKIVFLLELPPLLLTWHYLLLHGLSETKQNFYVDCPSRNNGRNIAHSRGFFPLYLIQRAVERYAFYIVWITWWRAWNRRMSWNLHTFLATPYSCCIFVYYSLHFLKKSINFMISHDIEMSALF